MKEFRAIAMLILFVAGLTAIAFVLYLLISAVNWISAHIAQILPYVIGLATLAGVVFALYLLERIILLHGQHHKNRVLHADPQRLVLLEGNLFRRRPVVYHTHLGQVTAVRELKEQEQAEEPKQIAAPAVKQPLMRTIISEIEPGALQVSPGVRADNGELVILSIEDAVHFKLIGSSGFGKSCLAAALLEQAITLNPPELLQIALLDLEHKTSRLFEDSPNVAVLQSGKRFIPMVATNANEVAAYLGYLKVELDRRAKLSETELQCEPILLMYVEEMLSLQLEVDQKLLDQMLKDLSVLAVRARKYRMFLLACAQTDYSTPELKIAQKQFRTRIAYAIDTTAARAAGFMSTNLIKQNFTTSQKGDGQFVLETPGIAALMLAPVYDVKQKLLIKERSSGVLTHQQNGMRTHQEPSKNDPENAGERAPGGHSAEVAELQSLNWGKQAIIEKVWNVRKGGSQRWKDAEAEYEQIIRDLERKSEQ